MGFIDKTKSQRVTDVLAVSIQTQSRSYSLAKDTYVVDLSTRGMRFTCESEPPADTPLTIELNLSSLPAPVTVMASIVSSTNTQFADNSCGYNTHIEFHELDDVTRHRLQQHITTVFEKTRVIKELPYRENSNA